MTTMRAMVIDATGGPDVFRQADIARPQRVNSEALVCVAAAGVNPIDAKTRSGRGASAAINAWPAVLGYDFSGVVVEPSFEAHPFPAGTEVFGMLSTPRSGGSYAEYVSVPTLQLARKPRSLSHLEAAGVPLAALTAWGAVVDVAKAHDGQRMLIHAGAGGVGHFAVQLARYFGARVTATASSANHDWLRQLGAERVIDYRAERFEKSLSGFDVVIDLVGNAADATGTRSLGVLRPGGLIVAVPTGTWPSFVEDVRGAGVRGTTYRVSPDGATLAVIARLIDAGDLAVTVEKVFDLADAAAAHTALESGHTRGKIVLRVAE